ncbi:MAG: T9SS type A sorting domain-containing protein [Bacteroidetes bacterium]|jgi:hypothetical protein|nr:T9SS type A sorting domain-containing protein [Bacteroidota bacterium]
MFSPLHFNRLVYALLLTVLTSLSLLADWDDDRDKKRKTVKNQTSKSDSIQFVNDDIDLQEQDDTLVFEDWDSSDGDAGVRTISVELGSKPAEISANSTETLLDNVLSSLTDRFTPLKNEYLVDFTLYPNPTVNELHLKTTNIPKSLTIIDLTGKQHTISSYSDTIDVSILTPGTYFIQLIYPDHIESRKFIKK